MSKAAMLDKNTDIDRMFGQWFQLDTTIDIQTFSSKEKRLNFFCLKPCAGRNA